jgi:hypothetical protein
LQTGRTTTSDKCFEKGELLTYKIIHNDDHKKPNQDHDWKHHLEYIETPEIQFDRALRCSKFNVEILDKSVSFTIIRHKNYQR